MKIISGGVCAPKGFMAGGIRCGIKASSAKPDLALIYSKTLCNAASVFTTNRVKAAPVIVSREHLLGGKLHAIIANSGNANACTGETGLNAARKMAELSGAEFNIKAEQVAVASTGVIGVPLPLELIEKNIKTLAGSIRDDETGHGAALEAIMTTDTRKKEISVEIEINGKPVRIGGMAKGSGMMHPNMATMLCFLTTDAVISSELLEKSLRHAVGRSFNRLTIDGDTSTNDTVIIMASGESGAAVPDGSAEYGLFTDALESACISLARGMAADGEGATKLLTVTVTGATDENTAEILAKSVASSSLVKAAFFGADANWGRILCAMGYAGADFNPEETSVVFSDGNPGGEIKVCEKGESFAFSEEKARKILSGKEITVLINAGKGKGNATVWGCDLTYDYVKINGDYRT